MVENKDSKKNNKVSRTVPSVSKFSRFRKLLIQELDLLKDHLKRSHMQYQAFKLAREEAKANMDAVTMQVDWSKNPKLRQSREEKSAYYHEDQVCIHPMYIWTQKRRYSRSAISNCTDHKAGAVFVSLKPVLNDFIKEGKKTINIVSDSPTSQYQNKKYFWLNQRFATENKTNIKWIYPGGRAWQRDSRRYRGHSKECNQGYYLTSPG